MGPGVLTLPAELGRYTLLERVGGGGMATVFRARLEGEGGFAKEVALKLIRPELAEDPDFVGMFEEEARVSGRLAHPNLVQTFDFGQVDGAFFLAMEFVHGLTLAQVGRRAGRSLPIPLCLHVCAEVARGLGHAHAATTPAGQPMRLVHRDVSPQNILLGWAGGVKLADFGIAKAQQRAPLTLPGRVRGKSAYMAPEQVRGRALDGRTDVFALGIVLWEILSGRRLFSGDSEAAVLLQVLEAEIDPPSRHRTEVPRAVDELVLRMLARDPETRPADGAAAARALAELALRSARSADELDVGQFMQSLRGETALLPRPPAAPPEELPSNTRISRRPAEPISLDTAAVVVVEESGTAALLAREELDETSPSRLLPPAALEAETVLTPSEASSRSPAPPSRPDGAPPSRLGRAIRALLFVASSLGGAIAITTLSLVAESEAASIWGLPQEIPAAAVEEAQHEVRPELGPGAVAPLPPGGAPPREVGKEDDPRQRAEGANLFEGGATDLSAPTPSRREVKRAGREASVPPGVSRERRAPATEEAKTRVAMLPVQPGLPAKRPRPSTPKEPDEAEQGILSVGARTAAQLWIDGERMPDLQPGKVVRLPVPPGVHRLRLRTEQGASCSVAAEVLAASSRSFLADADGSLSELRGRDRIPIDCR